MEALAARLFLWFSCQGRRSLCVPCRMRRSSSVEISVSKPAASNSSGFEGQVRSEVEKLLDAVNRGAAGARNDLLSRVYRDLHRLADGFMGPAGDGVFMLQATALVHEAYAKMFHNYNHKWENRAHFFRVAACAMRSVITDYVRQSRALKRRPSGKRVELDECLAAYEERSAPILNLDEALCALGDVDPLLVSLVELRFFAGQTVKEAARLVGMSERNAYRHLRLARAWLRRRLKTA